MADFDVLKNLPIRPHQEEDESKKNYFLLTF